MKIIKINENDKNIRLDNFLKKIYPNLSLSTIFKYIRIGKFKVNNKKTNFSYRLKEKDEVFCYIDINKINLEDNNLFLKAKSILEVVYEDKNILIVNKPPKLLVVDQSNKITDTLINRALKYLFKQNEWNPKNEHQFRPCLVHRIDFNTSGLVMIAKNHESSVILSEKLKNREIDKYYLCLVHGKMEKKQDLLQAFLIKDAKHNIVKISNKKNNGAKIIYTQYKVLHYDNKNNISKLEIKLITGKTHQIRAHLSFINHPIIGEKKYTNKHIFVNNDSKFQILIAYKLHFHFKSDARKLNYLNNKTIKLKITNL